MRSLFFAFVSLLFVFACGPAGAGTGGAGATGGASTTASTGSGGACTLTGQGVVAAATWNPYTGTGHAFGVTFTHPAAGENFATLDCPLPAGTFGVVASPTITPGSPGTIVYATTWTTGPGSFTVYTGDNTGPNDYVFSLQVVELP